MSETKHSPEPWRLSGLLYPLDNRSDVIANWDDMSLENARRIVACVNACAGIPTEALEAGALKDALWLLEVATVGGVKTLQDDEQGKAILRALGRLP